MPIPINFLTAVLKKRVIQESYPGGIDGFHRNVSDVREDDDLVGVTFMSGGELQSFIDLLVSVDFDVKGGLAVGDMFQGEVQSCPGILFSFERAAPINRRWLAVTVDETAREAGQLCMLKRSDGPR